MFGDEVRLPVIPGPAERKNRRIELGVLKEVLCYTSGKRGVALALLFLVLNLDQSYCTHQINKISLFF